MFMNIQDHSHYILLHCTCHHEQLASMGHRRVFVEISDSVVLFKCIFIKINCTCVNCLQWWSCCQKLQCWFCYCPLRSSEQTARANLSILSVWQPNPIIVLICKNLYGQSCWITRSCLITEVKSGSAGMSEYWFICWIGKILSSCDLANNQNFVVTLTNSNQMSVNPEIFYFLEVLFFGQYCMKLPLF